MKDRKNLLGMKVAGTFSEVSASELKKTNLGNGKIAFPSNLHILWTLSPYLQLKSSNKSDLKTHSGFLQMPDTWGYHHTSFNMGLMVSIPFLMPEAWFSSSSLGSSFCLQQDVALLMIEIILIFSTSFSHIFNLFLTFISSLYLFFYILVLFLNY